MNLHHNHDFNQLALKIKQFGKEFGFSQVGITDTNLTKEFPHFKTWLQSGYHGNMGFFEKHLAIYETPQNLLPTTKRVICCRMDYPPSPSLIHPIASFAKIQDYSTLISQLLGKYADKITAETKSLQKMRFFAGNAPILEKALAVKAGLGWYGKNSILINQDAGSYFFLGEILTDIPLPIDKPIENRCGKCFKCGDACPTKAIIAPYKLDARRCIAYLTGQYKGSITLELRPLIGTKIFGCDICQQVCPWNNCRKTRPITPFKLSPHLATDDLVAWFLWDEKEFLKNTKDFPIGRISHELWLRNIAIALGNSTLNEKILAALQTRLNHPSALVREHVEWALRKTQE